MNMCPVYTRDLQTTYFRKVFKTCDLSYIFASRLFLIWSSHVCVALTEYSGSLSNVFY